MDKFNELMKYAELLHLVGDTRRLPLVLEAIEKALGLTRVSIIKCDPDTIVIGLNT